jgi:hypothetical protein
VEVNSGNVIKQIPIGGKGYWVKDVKAGKILILTANKNFSDSTQINASLQVLDMESMKYSSKIDISGAMDSRYFGIALLTPDGNKVTITVPWQGWVESYDLNSEKETDIHTTPFDEKRRQGPL